MTRTRQYVRAGFFGGFVLAMLLMWGGPELVWAQEAAPRPAIFQAAPDIGGPNQAVMLVGDQFQDPVMYVYRLPDDAATPGRAAQVTELDPDQLPAGAVKQFAALARTEISLSGVIPADLAPGQYVVWARNGTTWSNPVTLNRTEVYFVYPDQANVAVDRTVRVIGKSLGINEKQAPIVVLKGADGRTYPMTLQTVQPYNLEGQIPQAVPAGRYEVWVSNGFGGNYGWSAAQTLTIVNQPRATQEFAITQYGAAADQGDNQQAIQAAIDAAHDAGGGVVTVPAGTFVIHGPLHLTGGVTLRGLGDFASDTYPSVIKYYDDPKHILTVQDNSYIMQVESDTVLEGIRLVGSKSVDRGIIMPPGAHDLAFRNNFIDTFFPTYEDKKTANNKSFYSGITASGRNGGQPMAVVRMEIVRNKFEGRGCVNLENVHYVRIAGNLVHGRINTPLNYCGVSRAIMEGNHIDGQDVDGSDGAARGFTANVCNTGMDRAGFRGSERNYFADNLIEHVGTWNSFRNNNGEYINFDCLGDSRFPGTYSFRNVTAAGADTVTVHNVNFSDGKASPWDRDRLVGTKVMVVYGKGAGQLRDITANDADTLTVSPAWIVPPDRTSKIVTARFFDRNILYRNVARNNKGNCYLLWGLCTNMILDGNVAEQEGVMIAGCEVPKNPDQYGISYYNLVQNSRMPALTIESRASAKMQVRNGYLLLGNVLRDNQVTRELGIKRNREGGGNEINTISNLVENNTSPQAFVTMSNATDTVLRGNQVTGK